MRDGNGPAPLVLVVGSTMTDLIAYAPALPAAGETVVGESFSIGFGGKGANQAVMAALLGASVHFVGSLGDDVFGEMTIANLRAFGIDTSTTLVTAGEASGAAPIWVDSTTGENRIIVVPGANDRLSPGTVASAVDASRPDVVLTQFEVPEECVRAALDGAERVGCISVLNPAPMREADLALFGRPDWVIPNESELAAVARLLGVGPSGDLPDVAARCAEAIGTNLVVTAGAKGALLCIPGEVPVAIDAPSAEVVDTTGAGDAFVGAFAYALAGGAKPGEAAAFACACATASVGRKGTQVSFPRGDELARLEKGGRWNVIRDR